MTKIINRGNAARVAVLLVVAALTLSWVHVASSSSSTNASSTRASTRAPDRDPAPAVEAAPVEAPVQETVVPAAPAPAATPLPAPAPEKVGARQSHPKHHSAKARHGRQARHARHNRNARHARHARHTRHTRHARHARHGRHASHARQARHARQVRLAERRAEARRRAARARAHWRHAGGRDISWPQCPPNVGFGGRNGLGQPMPDPGIRFVVVGLTNGRAFTPNPCLDAHLRWVREHHAAAAAYAFAAFPSRGQLKRHRHHGPYDGRKGIGALSNAGYAAAGYNIRVMQRSGFTTPHVWLDVEPSSSHPWSHRRQLNRAVARGWIRGYRDAGYTVGVYSTPLLWQHILGGFRPRLPEWRTAGPTSAGAALGKCGGESIQGGPAVIAQWWTAHRDFDRLCPSPSRSTTMATYFHQW